MQYHTSIPINMKKNLIFLSMALLCAIRAFAITDGQTYQPVNDYNLVNKWIFDRVHTTDFIHNPA